MGKNFTVTDVRKAIDGELQQGIKAMMRRKGQPAFLKKLCSALFWLDVQLGREDCPAEDREAINVMASQRVLGRGQAHAYKEVIKILEEWRISKLDCSGIDRIVGEPIPPVIPESLTPEGLDQMVKDVIECE